MGDVDVELLLSTGGGMGRVVLGPNKTKIYVKSDDCIGCLKDIQRQLRNDDPKKRGVFRLVAHLDIVRTDLIPMITTYVDDMEVVYNALKVITFMTMPVEHESDDPLGQVEIMQAIKEVFIGAEVLPLIVGLLEEPLQRHPRMSESDALMVQLVVAFLRNIIAIPDRQKAAGGSGDNRTRLRGQLLQTLRNDDVLELLLVLAQHCNQHPLRSEAALLLEIFYNIFEGVDAKVLLDAKPPQYDEGTEQAKRILAREKAALKNKGTKSGVSRLPRFGGLFVQRHTDVISTVLGSNPNKATQVSAFGPQGLRGKDKQRQGEEVARLDQAALVSLREYAEQFLEASYDVLMGAVRRDLEPGRYLSRLGRDDFLRFTRFARFCTSFVRQQQERKIKEKRERAKAAKARGETEAEEAGDEEAASPFGCISATMGWEMFRMVLDLWHYAINWKLKDRDWDLQHAVLGLLKELLMTLDLAQHVGPPPDRKASDRLQRRLFHDDLKDTGVLTTLGKLIKNFRLEYQPPWHAADLVETTHVVLRLLERLSRAEGGKFLVKKAVRRGRGPSKKKPTPTPEEGAARQSASPGRNAVGDAPADGNAEPEGGEQSPNVGADPAPAPETAAGGTDDADAESGGDVSHGTPGAGSAGNPGTAEKARDRLDPFEAENEAEEEEERQMQMQMQTKEVTLDLMARIRQELAHPWVVHFYVWLLQDYKNNSAFLNHCIHSYLQRLVDPAGLNCEPMLYQIRALAVFQQIMADSAFRKNPSAAPIIHFCLKVTRNVFKRIMPLPPPRLPSAQKSPEGEGAGDMEASGGLAVAKADPSEHRRAAKAHDVCGRLLLVEMLFWKDQRGAELVREQYHWQRHFGPGRGEAPRRLTDDGLGDDEEQAGEWTESQEEHLKDLYAQYGTTNGALLQIVEGLHGEFTEGQVVAKLRGLGYPVVRLAPRMRDPAVRFSADEEARLVAAWEAHFNEKGAMQRIFSDMGSSFKKSQLKRKLDELGLKRGVLTQNQKTMLEDLLEVHKGEPNYLQLIANGLGAGWTSGIVRKHLKNLDLLPKGRRRQGGGDVGNGRGGGGAISDLSGEESDSSVDTPAVGAGWGGGANSSPSDGEGGDEAASGAAAEKSKKAKKREKRQTLLPGVAKRQRVADWDDDDDSDVGPGAPGAGARPSTSASSGAADSSGDSDSDTDSPPAENPRPSLGPRPKPSFAQSPPSHTRRPAKPSDALQLLADGQTGITPGPTSQLSAERRSGGSSPRTNPTPERDPARISNRHSASDADDDSHPPARKVLGRVENRMGEGGEIARKEGGKKKKRERDGTVAEDQGGKTHAEGKKRERQGTVADDAEGKRSGNGYGVSDAAKGALAQLHAKRARLAEANAEVLPQEEVAIKREPGTDTSELPSMGLGIKRKRLRKQGGGDAPSSALVDGDLLDDF